MKKIFKSLFVPVLMLLALVSCKKDEKKIFYEGGTAPVLTGLANSGGSNIDLNLADAAKDALVLAWTNPEYKFTTGVSSQDVAYVIEIDTEGSNFSSASRKATGVNNDLKYVYTQRALNDHLTDNLSLEIGKPANLEMRVIASLTKNNIQPFVSNVLKFTATPYQDPSKLPVDLYITGDATPSGWTNSPPPSQKFTYLGGKKYEIVMDFVPGKLYKFLTKLGAWQPQYGSSSPTGGALGLNDGTGSDPDAIPTPAVAGTYKISVNLGNQTFAVEKL
jgi:starch-binding outer membrane protein SusE/F